MKQQMDRNILMMANPSKTKEQYTLTMKKRILFISLAITVLTACSPSKQYGVDVLNLDEFNFDLSIEKFFQDERIFRNKHEDFYVSSREHYIDEDSIQMGYIQYSTTVMTRNRPLASYAGVKFESLSIIADEADEKALMAVGSTSYAKPKDVEKIIARLLSINDTPEMRRKSWTTGTNLIVREGDKVINLYLNIDIDTEAMRGEERFTSDQYSALRYVMAGAEAIKCILFVTNRDFDRALSAASNYSGDLTHYKK